MNAYAQATEDDDVPDEVTGIGDQVSNLSAARGGGKISPTQYWLAIDNIAKDYRARYPGHRDYIDQTISSITGHNPANAYMSSIMSDLNYALRGNTKVDPNVRQATTALGTMAKEGALPDAQIAELYSRAQTDPIGVMRVINTLQAPKHASDATKWELDAQQNNMDIAMNKARTAVPKYVTDSVWAHFNGNTELAGVSMATIQKEVADMTTDPSKADPQRVLQLGLFVQQLRQKSEMETRQWLDAPVGPNGESRAQIAAGRGVDPGKYVNDLIRERYQIFDNVAKNLSEKSPALATLQAERMQAQATNDQYNALKTDFGQHLRIMNLLQKYPKDMQEYMKTVLTKDYGNPNVNVFVKDMMSQFMTSRSQGKLISIDDAIKKAQVAGVTDPRVYKDFADFGEQIMNPNLSHEARVNIAASMFNPKNFGFLSNFNEDKVIVDPSGVTRTVPGKYAIWQKYTNPAFASQIREIAAKNPEVGTWYRNWVQQGFGSDIFGPQVRELSKMAADPRAQITYNNITNQFNPPSQDTPDFWSAIGARSQRRAGVQNQMETSIALLNTGLHGLATEAASRGITEPSQVQGYILGQLKGLGFVPPEPKVRPDPKTLTDQLFNAFISAAKQFSPLQGKETKK